MMDSKQSLQRFYTMSDWQEFEGFDCQKLLKEIKIFSKHWKRYNPKKLPNNRWGLSVTSIDGGLSGVPDLSSLLDYEKETGKTITNLDLNKPTNVWKQSEELTKILEPWKQWVTRCHFLRMDKGSFFPDHYDINKHDPSYDEIRLTGFVNVNEYGLKWIYDYDDKVIKCQNGSLWYFNANKRHCVFSTQDNMILLIICLKWDSDLLYYIMDNGVVK